MLDVDTFLTTLYVICDEFCQSHRPQHKRRPGPEASLSEGEVITLSIFARCSWFASERDFYRSTPRAIFCIWLNDQLGRPRLKFADLMGW